MASSRLKILFLGANPLNTTRLRIDEELREIDQQLRLSKARERLVLAQAWAVRADDLQQSLIDNEPQIVHFSGHGDTAGIAIEDDNGNARIVSNEAISDLFELFKESVKCVVLNACYSEQQAESIRKHVPYVVGMRSEMPDDAAIKFSVGFYKAIAAGKTVEFAFNLGVNAIKLEGLEATLIPKLFKSQDNLQLLPDISLDNTQPLESGINGVNAANSRVKWIAGSVAAALIMGVAGFFIAKNQPEKELSYRIGDAQVDLYKNTKDSLLMTFELVCDNNTQRNLSFVRDSVTLSFEDLDTKFMPYNNGVRLVNIEKNENKTVKIEFVTPMRFKPLSICIAQKRGKAFINYGFGNLVTTNLPIADANIDQNKPIVLPSPEPLPLPPTNPKEGKEGKNNKENGGKKPEKLPKDPKEIKITVIPKPTIEVQPTKVTLPKSTPKIIPEIENNQTVSVAGNALRVNPAVVSAMRRIENIENKENKEDKAAQEGEKQDAPVLQKVTESPILRKRSINPTTLRKLQQ